MDDKKRYKATDIKVDGPFEGWIIEELTDEEAEKEEAKEKEAQAQKVASVPQKLTPQEMEKKREEQLNKIRDLINQKRKAKQEAAQKTAPQQAPQPAPVQNAPSPTPKEEPEDLEEMLQKKSKDTGIPVEVLRMIEEKKKEIRARKKAEGNPTGGGVEIYDTVKARREREEQEKYYEEHQERTPKKKVPNGEEIGDRETIYPEEKQHDLYNIMDDVGLDDDM